MSGCVKLAGWCVLRDEFPIFPNLTLLRPCTLHFRSMFVRLPGPVQAFHGGASALSAPGTEAANMGAGKERLAAEAAKEPFAEVDL